ncbi:MAG: glycolate oxidase subunit GlcF, partial [Gammaproteobacteria bacterium]|nr:glycolate oxidase subunit GlcF [Gammaproteobacteria bacterium]
MQTHLTDAILNTPQGQEAEAILRKCVHCGFCTATCPTYLLLGNELDSPRGRIYLMKQVLEGEQATKRTQLHLDRCLTCRACETTCPSGVEYGKLLDIGRELVDREVSRKFFDRTMRAMLQLVVPNTILLKVMMFYAWLVRPILPVSLRTKIPSKEPTGRWPVTTHLRRMIIHQGCVQRVTKPGINAAAARYLDANSISAIRTNDACCGALGLHLGNRAFFERYARKNIDAWWPQIESGAEAIVSTASGCGVTIKDYGDLLKRDPDYADKARRVSELTVDISEVAVDAVVPSERKRFARVAFQSPCTLQHGQKNVNTVEKILNHHGVDT